MANNFIPVVHRKEWVCTAPMINAHAAGMGIGCDLRTHGYAYPWILQLASATVLNKYHVVNKAWRFVSSPALAGTFGAGAGCVFAPSMGLTGSVGAGCTTTSVVTTTTITAVGKNMLANRGNGTGYILRVVGKTSGKTEEREIIGNTSGTTPTLLVASAFTFTPASGDLYEIAAGRLFMLSAGTTAAGVWKSYEMAANTLSGNLSTTNLPATISTDFSAIALDEQYNPADHIPGEGLIVGASTYDNGTKRCLLATASGASTITGQSSAGDAVVAANEYRNFQIRIVEDTATPAANGQRSIIASHTAGASPVYTVGAAWTTQPSSSAKFVIEYPNIILLRSSATTSVYVYNYSGSSITNGTNTIANDAWSTSYFAAAGSAMGAGCTMFHSSGIQPDSARNARHSFVHCFRGGSSTALDVLDIAGATTGSWENGAVYDGGVTIGTGTCGKLAPGCCEGKFGYLNVYSSGATNQIYRYDVKSRQMSPEANTNFIQTGAAAAGDRVATMLAIRSMSPYETYSVVLQVQHLATLCEELVIQ